MAYASRLMTTAERDYSITEKECLALVWVVKNFRSFVWGYPIRIVMNHHALCWLTSKKELAGGELYSEGRVTVPSKLLF